MFYTATHHTYKSIYFDFETFTEYEKKCSHTDSTIWDYYIQPNDKSTEDYNDVILFYALDEYIRPDTLRYFISSLKEMSNKKKEAAVIYADYYGFEHLSQLNLDLEKMFEWGEVTIVPDTLESGWEVTNNTSDKGYHYLYLPKP